MRKKNMELSSFFPLGRSVRGKLIFWLLIISLVPMAVLGIAGYKYSSQSLQAQSFDRMESTLSFQRQALQNYFDERLKNLESITANMDILQQQTYAKISAIKNIRKQQVAQFFHSRTLDVQLFSNSPEQRPVATGLNTGFPEKLDSGYSTFLKKWLANSYFRSVTLINSGGKILYSTDKKIRRNSWVQKGTQEFTAFQKGKLETSFTDFALSSLLIDEPVAYFSTPFKGAGNYRAVFLFSLKTDAFDGIMNDTTGLGESGESYLVGADGLFRSNSQHFEESTLANPAFLVDSEDVAKALAGKSGEEVVVDYRGKYVLSSYAPIEVHGMTWALIVVIDQTETVAPKLDEGEGDHLTHIVDNYGFPDLYLLGRDGHIFYSAKQKPDYLTNILSGPYSNSTFAATISKVLETKHIVISDYSLYEPSGSKPVAFLAKPIMHNDAVIMIVAIQLPIDQIGTVIDINSQANTQQATSDTYLIGQDKLWRTESKLAEKYNVPTILLNPKAALNTIATTAALSGESGTQVTVNGVGETVLSSWAPFVYKDLKWAIIREISLNEVEKPITGLVKIIAVIAILALLAVIVISLWISGGITRQVSEIMKVMAKVEKGEYGEPVEITRRDELGAMASSFNGMIGTIQSLVTIRQEKQDQFQHSIITLLEEITDLASGDLSIRATVREDETGTLADSLNMMLEEMGDAIGKIKQSSEQVGSTANSLSSSTAKLAVNSDSQSGMINDAVIEMNRLTHAIEEAAQKADQSAETSKISSQVAEDGAKAVEDTSQAMEAIRGNVQDTARAIKRLGKSSQEISDFTRTIYEISDRTSILALNASIQAAAAGEEGRGFAFIAEEIQRLSERAASSTKQIKTLIKNILGEITKASTSMDASIQEVVHGTSLSKNALARIDEITRRSSEVADLISGIATSSKEQAGTTVKLAQTMGNIGAVSLKTAGETRQASSTISEMATIADDMLQVVATFKLSPEDQIDVHFGELDDFDENDFAILEKIINQKLNGSNTSPSR